MSAPPANYAAGADEAAEPGRGFRFRLFETVVNTLVQAGEIVRLLGTVAWLALRHPLSYWGEVRDQMFHILRICFIPLVVSTAVFGFGAPGLVGENLFSLFGITERLGAFLNMATIREFAPWVNAMVIAGVVGTSITSDLGARRVRGEIDALEVLAVDPVRTLVLPRVIALTVMTALLNVVALTCGLVGGYVAGVPVGGASSAALLNNLFNNLTTVDVWGSVAKTAIFGLIIGVVCSYKGLAADGGPIGVGRAVNQAVVIAFASIWIVNFLFTATMLGLNPDIQVYR